MLTPTLGASAAGAFAISLYTFGNVVYALVACPIGVLADRVDRRLVFGTGFSLFGVLCLGFLAVDAQRWLLVLLFAPNGVYTAIIESSQPALASALTRDDQHGTGFGLMSFVDGLGDFVSSIAIGALWTMVSPQLGFALAGVTALASAAMLLGMHLSPVIGDGRHD